MTLQERAIECYGTDFEKLSKEAQKCVRQDCVSLASDDMLKALQAVAGLFAEGSPFYINKLGPPITNGDQEKIDKAFIATADAIAKARGLR